MKTLFCTTSRNWRGPDQTSEKEDKWRVKMEEQSKTEEQEQEDESQPSINLGLGIGGPSSDHLYTHKGRIVKEDDDDDQVKVYRYRELSVVCFTEEQMVEFKTQVSIFKYMVSGLPVPLQLVLPIWRSFSSSFAPSYPYLHRNFPFLLGSWPWGFDSQYKMDLEPGRCRRTDGKKWRCHQSVIPNEKYCEKHMHRGRKRSRKLVEPEPSSENLSLKVSNQSNNPIGDRVKSPENLAQKSQPLNSPAPSRVVIRPPSLTHTTTTNNEKQTHSDVGNHNRAVKERIAALTLSSGLGFSPKSVLHDGQSCPKTESHHDDPTSELGRCRRTDGKKWRCSNETILGQKYCAHHMNRGAKKPAVALSAYRAPASSMKLNGPDRVQMGPRPGPDTKLKVSFTTSSAAARLDTEDHSADGNEMSGSTSETTITDDSTDVSDTIAISP